MTRCPQKQGFPGVPVGAQTLTRPFRLFSRVCSCPVAPRAGPGSHPPPPGPCVTGTPRTPWGACQPAPAFLPPTPPQSTGTCTSTPPPVLPLPFRLSRAGPSSWSLWTQWPTWHCTGSALGFGFGDRDLGQGRAWAAEHQTVDGFERHLHQDLHVRCHLPTSLESECWNFVTFIYGKKI